jgi:hypothetical protein
MPASRDVLHRTEPSRVEYGPLSVGMRPDLENPLPIHSRSFSYTSMVRSIRPRTSSWHIIVVVDELVVVVVMVLRNGVFCEGFGLRHLPLFSFLVRRN